MDQPLVKPDPGRKLFFGLFIFPLLITVGMAVLLCSVVLLTHEEQSPETLIAAIKTVSPAKRWQKAFELSNELNKAPGGLRAEALGGEIIQILTDPGRYDAKTRAYMAAALGHLPSDAAVAALERSLEDDSADVRIYSLWSLGSLGAKISGTKILPLLFSAEADTRKTAAYILGSLGVSEAAAPLREALKDPIVDVRWNAALSLARLGDDAGYPVLVRMLDRDELAREHGMDESQIEAVMTNAAKGFALIQKAESIKILTSIAKNEKNLRVRQAAMDTLEKIS